jgi:hypothetical protein
MLLLVVLEGDHPEEGRGVRGGGEVDLARERRVQEDERDGLMGAS